jgi:hypothetical protein
MKRLLFLFFLMPVITHAQGWLWARDSRINTNGSEEGGPMAIDNFGNVYGINAVGSLLFGPGIITSTYGRYSVTDSLDLSQSVAYRLDDSGNYRWAIGTYGGVQLTNLFTDDARNVYLSGHKNSAPGYFAGFSLTGTASEDFIVKLDSSGLGIWIRELPASIDLNNIAVSHFGDIFFTGDLASSPITFGASTITGNKQKDVILGKYDSSGNQQWAISFGGDSTDVGNFISVTDNGAIYLAGSSSSSSLVIGHDTLINASAPGNTFFFVCRIDTGKNIEWGRSIIPSPAGGIVNGIAADKWDNIYCSGGYYGTMYSGPVSLPVSATASSRMFLFRFDSSGNIKWGKTIADTLLLSANAVDADDCGNIWICGQGGRPSVAGYDPMYIANFDTSGYLRDTLFLISGGDDANWLKLDKKGFLYVSGDYEQKPFIVGSDTLHAAGSNEYLFVAKYIYDLPDCIRDTIPYPHIKTFTENMLSKIFTISIFPNPATTFLTITASDKITKVTITTLLGQTICNNYYHSEEVQVNVADLPPGMYLLRINDTEIRKFVKHQ